jgi:hypothetical protein
MNFFKSILSIAFFKNIFLILQECSNNQAIKQFWKTLKSECHGKYRHHNSDMTININAT